MIFGIFTHVPHSRQNEKYFAYGPYVKEMNLWSKYVDQIVLVAPKGNKAPDAIDIAYTKTTLKHITIPSFSLLGIGSKLRALFIIPVISWQVFKAMRKVDHIHLRCPGNIGLIACFIQIFFPKKPKTAKYAGNWDPKAKQPWSYRLQKSILSNTRITKNIQVLAYGHWPGQSKNIRSFFTATYKDTQIPVSVTKTWKAPYKFLFVGTLSPGKRPIWTAQFIENLYKSGKEVSLDIYGDGAEREPLEAYIDQHDLSTIIHLHGNVPSDQIQQAYKEAHFLILNSKSEGWPKVVAESMFWGLVPIASQVSCVPWMLDNENRGMLLKGDNDHERLISLLQQPERLSQMSRNAMEWSHGYTLDFFEAEIKKMLGQ